MQNSLLFIIDAVSDLYVSMFLLRFVLQWIRAGYQNPLAQFVMRITAPLVVPARRLLPSVRGADLPTLVVAVLLEALTTLLLFAVAGYAAPLGTFVAVVVLRLVSLMLWIYCIAIFLYVILSLLSGYSYHPLAAALGELVEPVLRPVRRLIPPIAGLDLSPAIVVILLQAVIIALPGGPLVR